jgi:TolB protein
MLRVHRRFIESRYTVGHTASGKRRRAEMLYRVVFGGANLIKMSLVITAAMLAICLLALVETTDVAEATSLPQNGKIAFTSFHVQDKDYGIFTVDPDGSSLRWLTNNVEPYDHLAWSPDGTKLAINEYDGPIWVMGADGSNLRRLTSNRSDLRYSSPTWTPDGTTLAFGIDNDPSKFGNDLYTMDVDGSNKTRITNSPKIYKSSIDISPDGSQICLSQKDEIFVMNVDGSNLTRLTTERGNVNATDCSWSPDATKIAYAVVPWGIAGGPDLFDAEVCLMNADGSGKTKLTNTPEGTTPFGAGSWDPEWSPDGAKIAFTSNRGSNSQYDSYSDIYTMDADGSDVARVTNLPGDEQHPDWQPLPGTTVHQPDTGGPSLLLVAITLLFSAGVMFYAGVKRRV